LRIDFQDLMVAEIGHQQIMRDRIEAHAEQQVAAVVDLQYTQPASIAVEYDDRADRRVAADV
jgi:hypothetical protein